MSKFLVTMECEEETFISIAVIDCADHNMKGAVRALAEDARGSNQRWAWHDNKNATLFEVKEDNLGYMPAFGECNTQQYVGTLKVENFFNGLWFGISGE
jgi:hypothetical protein